MSHTFLKLLFSVAFVIAPILTHSQLPSLSRWQQFTPVVCEVSTTEGAIGVDATVLRTHRKRIVEAGVSIRVRGSESWCDTPTDTPQLPFRIVLTSLQTGTEYEIAAYAVTRRGGRVESPIERITLPAATPAFADGRWCELPAFEEDSDSEFITHYTTIEGERRRNFSMLYDHSAKIAVWVAYPIHDCYLGKAARTDAWAFDPMVGQQSQMNMRRSGFTDDNGYGSYDRGHQIPSADRTANAEANAATFYYTNMTPQQSNFNRGLWGKLEAFVRNNVPASDTLWVVTGCALTTPEHPTPLYASHNTYGGRIAVPRAYFKVLLRSSVRGTTPDDTTAECIGFWLPNEAPSSTKLNSSWAVSVNQIESLTGYDFFPGLSDSVEEKFDPALWKW
ncbi:MAG: DNA/RNA non-specific endonuclease [Rikenellaceae bacterium]|nr:DNA/RNA non-specific endonuclease [Rikenellaceae bacterium]